MFTLDSLATPRHRDNLRQAPTETPESSDVKAATPATNVAIVAMSHVAEPDERFRQPSFRRAVIAARDAAPLHDFSNGLQVGALVICCNCKGFAFGPDPAGLGHCQHFDVEAGPFTPFPCAGFALSKEPVAPKFMPYA
jgi:hypothetical protein